MADPTTPTVDPSAIISPTPEQNQSWSTFEENTAAAGQRLEHIGSIGTAVGTVFSTLTDKLDSAGISLKSVGSIVDGSSGQFGLLTTSILGAREAFTSLAGVDTSRLVTYMDQFKELSSIIQAGPGTSTAAKAIEGVLGAMTSMGASSDTLKKAQTELRSGVMTTAAAFLTSADNITRLQNSFLQMAIAGGGAGDLFDGLHGSMGKVGTDLQNLNNVTDLYTKALEKGTAALGGSQKAQNLAAQYMAQLSRMPGQLNNVIKATEVAGQRTDLLTASLAIASGTGRSEEEVLGDINKVLSSYKSLQDDANVTAGAAATLTSRMGLLSKDLGADIKDVQGALMGQTDAFKMFVGQGTDVTKMTQQMSDAMSDYVSKLESVGVPAQNAIEMFKNYTNTVANMNTGQKAFLSTMSGGAGGLKGAFQIDAMIKRGDMQELQRKVGDTIKKMTGPIVSLDEASKSESAASQYQRQIMILQQGPLGAMAKTPQEAENLLAAMKEGKPVSNAKSPEERMQLQMKEGTKIQKDSYTQLVDINQSLNTLVLRAGEANKITGRQVLGTGNTGALAGGVGGTGAGLTPGGGVVAGPTAPNQETFKQFQDIARNLPKNLKDSWSALRESMGSGNRETMQQFSAKMEAAIKQEKGNLTDAQKQAMAQATSVIAGLRSSDKVADKATPPGTTVKPLTPPPSVMIGQGDKARKLSYTPLDSYAPAGKQVGKVVSQHQAATTTTGPGARGGGTTTTGPHQMGGPTQPVPVTLAGGQGITLHFTCPNCGSNVRTQTTTSDTTSPQAGARH
jgi:hypothetical protein